jgi:hypothetical protein
MCDYTLAGLRAHCASALKKVNEEVGLMRKYACMSTRFLDAYRQGATGRLADYATRKYRGHRCLPADWLSAIKTEHGANFDAKFGEEQHDADNSNISSENQNNNGNNNNNNANIPAPAQRPRRMMCLSDMNRRRPPAQAARGQQ